MVNALYVFKECIAVKDTVPLISPKLFPLTSNTHIPLCLALSGAVPEVLYTSSCSCAVGYLGVLNPFRTFTFHGHTDFEEEPELHGAGCSGEGG